MHPVTRSPATRYLHLRTVTPRRRVCLKHEAQRPLRAVNSKGCPEKHRKHVRDATNTECPREGKGWRLGGRGGRGWLDGEVI